MSEKCTPQSDTSFNIGHSTEGLSRCVIELLIGGIRLAEMHQYSKDGVARNHLYATDLWLCQLAIEHPLDGHRIANALIETGDRDVIGTRVGEIAVLTMAELPAESLDLWERASRVSVCWEMASDHVRLFAEPSSPSTPESAYDRILKERCAAFILEHADLLDEG